MGKLALVVDDSRLARMTLCKMLKKLDYDVREASGVIEGESIMAMEQADLVFMDVMMPELDGFDGLRRLQEKPETRRIPVIMYSGDVSEESIRKAYANGATGYLQKPASERALHEELNKVSNLLSGMRLEDGIESEAAANERMGMLGEGDAMTGNAAIDIGRLRAMFDEELAHSEQRMQSRIQEVEENYRKMLASALHKQEGLIRESDNKQGSIVQRFNNLSQVLETERASHMRTERELRDKLNQALEALEAQQKWLLICGIIAVCALILGISGLVF